MFAGEGAGAGDGDGWHTTWYGRTLPVLTTSESARMTGDSGGEEEVWGGRIGGRGIAGA